LSLFENLGGPMGVLPIFEIRQTHLIILQYISGPWEILCSS